MVDIPLSDFRKMAIEEFDTTKLLKHAAQQRPIRWCSPAAGSR